jgi:uncharacterized membrane protein
MARPCSRRNSANPASVQKDEIGGRRTFWPGRIMHSVVLGH